MGAPLHTLKTDAQVVTYFQHAAEVVGDAPFVLQDFPLATEVVIPVSAILEIVESCPTCVMLKHEDWPGLEKISALRAAAEKGARRISILCGNGGLYLPEELARGADGAMTGFAYPEMMAQVIAAYQTGATERARDIVDAYLPLIRYDAQPGMGPSPRQTPMAPRGGIPPATVRKPGGGLSAAAKAELAALVARQEARLRQLDV